MNYIHKNKAFTIIELLIVIVIIGVLAAITAVSYTGITKQAKEAVIKSDLKQASTQLEIAKSKSSNSQYPGNTNDLKSSTGTMLEITSTGTTYCQMLLQTLLTTPRSKMSTDSSVTTSQSTMVQTTQLLEQSPTTAMVLPETTV